MPQTNKEESENRENEEITNSPGKETQAFGMPHDFSVCGQSNRAETLLKAYGKSRMGPLSVKALIGAMVNTGNLAKSFFKHNLLRVVVLSRKENLLQFSMYPEAGHTAHIQQGACKPWESQRYL